MLLIQLCRANIYDIWNQRAFHNVSGRLAQRVISTEFTYQSVKTGCLLFVDYCKSNRLLANHEKVLELAKKLPRSMSSKGKGIALLFLQGLRFRKRFTCRGDPQLWRAFLPLINSKQQFDTTLLHNPITPGPLLWAAERSSEQRRAGRHKM